MMPRNTNGLRLYFSGWRSRLRRALWPASLFVGAFSLFSQEDGEFRSFTNQEGERIVARVTGIPDQGMLRIERYDGRTFQMPFADLSEEDQEYVRSLEITRSLLSDLWESSTLGDEWELVGQQGEKRYSYRGPAMVFGEVAVSVEAIVSEEGPERIQVLYLEAGHYFGYRRSRELRYHLPTTDGEERRRLLETIRQLERQEELDAKSKRTRFAAEYKRLQRAIPAHMEARTGGRLARDVYGAGGIRLPGQSMEYNDLVLHFHQVPDQMIALTIEPKGIARQGLFSDTRSLTQRREAMKQNVERRPNGDVLIENIPTIHQGSRGYCAIGTLSMIARYHGIGVDIDMLAARGGYREGMTARYDQLQRIYEEAARVGELNVLHQRRFYTERVREEISQGRPVLVWRSFTRERDAFHSEFARRFRSDPSLRLPDPDEVRDGRKERERWPDRRSGGHASVIDGYNRERGEFIFSESWGEDPRHRRMLVEEMEETVYAVWVFR